MWARVKDVIRRGALLANGRDGWIDPEEAGRILDAAKPPEISYQGRVLVMDQGRGRSLRHECRGMAMKFITSDHDPQRVIVLTEEEERLAQIGEEYPFAINTMLDRMSRKMCDDAAGRHEFLIGTASFLYGDTEVVRRADGAFLFGGMPNRQNLLHARHEQLHLCGAEIHRRMLMDSHGGPEGEHATAFRPADFVNLMSGVCDFAAAFGTLDSKSSLVCV